MKITANGEGTTEVVPSRTHRSPKVRIFRGEHGVHGAAQPQPIILRGESESELTAKTRSESAKGSPRILLKKERACESLTCQAAVESFGTRRYLVSMRAFILNPTYRVVGGRPEVHLYASLETEEPCLIVDDRVRPYFFVREADAKTVNRIAPHAVLESGELRTFAGEAVARVSIALPGDVPRLRRRL